WPSGFAPVRCSSTPMAPAGVSSCRSAGSASRVTARKRVLRRSSTFRPPTRSCSAMGKAGSMRLRDKVAVITGAASGFGEGMARRFAEEGAKIVVADLNAKGAERVAGEIGENAIAVTTDVSLRSEVEEMVYAAKTPF